MVKPLFLILVLTLSFLASCGSKTNSPTTKATNAPSFLTLTEANCESPGPIEIYSNAQNFSSRIGRFATLYNQRVGASIQNLEGVAQRGTELFLHSSALNPLIISEARLEDALVRSEVLFKNLVGKNNYDFLLSVDGASFAITPLSSENTELFNELVSDTRDLLTKALRWQSLQCSLLELSERKGRDVRSYYLLQEEREKGSSTAKVNEAVLNICNEFHPPVICLSEQQILKRQNRIGVFNEHYEKMGQEKTQVFFKRHGSHQFSCRREESKIVLEVPYVADTLLVSKLGRTFLKMEEEISEKWSNERLSIQLKKVEKKEEGVLDFHWISGGISFVERSNPLTVNLSEFLSQDLLMLTINHELGHVLGFPDCYQEFYDKKKKEIIYYSLDESSKNLMCTMNSQATIPNLYFDQLIESACKFN